MESNNQDLESILRVLQRHAAPQNTPTIPPLPNQPVTADLGTGTDPSVRENVPYRAQYNSVSSASQSQPNQVPVQDLLRQLQSGYQDSSLNQVKKDAEKASPVTAPGHAPLHNEPRQQDSSTSRAAASGITKWQAALRLVNKLGADPQFEAVIEKLIRDQRKHEQQWWSGREDLLKRQEARQDSIAQLNNVFRSIGSLGGTTARASTDEENAAEIAAYDQKVHKASTSMTQAMSAELSRLGVPFFCIDRGLVQSTNGHNSSGSNIGITEDDLMQLKRRLLEHLVDLYGDT